MLYSDQEIAEIRRGLTEANAIARAVAEKSGVTLHPRVAAMKAAIAALK
jgi:hypothetical protein